MPLRLKEALPTVSLSEQAYQVLKREIISGNLARGEKLNIHELAERMQISRTPVKEAINLLAQQGLVTVRSRKATFVSVVEAERIRELFDARLMIELWGAERRCSRPGLWDLKKIEEIVRGCDCLFSEQNGSFDYEKFTQADMSFHLEFVNASQNTEISRLYESLSVHIQAMRVYWHRARRPALNSHHEHIEILKALQAKNFERLKRSLTTHILNSRNDVIRVLRESKA